MNRKLTDRDARLWKHVTRTVTPKERLKAAPTREAFAAMMRVATETPSAPRRPGPLEVTRAKAVRRGRVRVEARIDLHDLTLAAGRPALERGLIRAYNRGKGCVLVITGKGIRLEGKLRAALPGWLAEPALRPIIATYAPAHIKHGGSGAWYVFLKRAA